MRRGASRDQIKRAHYEAMSKNHPDKVSHLDPALQAVALERTRRITEAYSQLNYLSGAAAAFILTRAQYALAQGMPWETPLARFSRA